MPEGFLKAGKDSLTEKKVGGIKHNPLLRQMEVMIKRRY